MSGQYENLAMNIRRLVEATWKFFTGVVVAVVVFATNFVDFKQPDVSVEITSVATSSTDPIDIHRIPELSVLRDLISGRWMLVGDDIALPPDEIERQIGIQSNQLATQTAKFEHLERQFHSLQSNPVKDQESALRDLAMELVGPMLGGLQEPASENEKNPQERHNALVRYVRKLLDSERKELNASVEKFKNAEKQWTVFKDTVLPNRARLVVTCAVGNRGSGATSLKPQGLLRANLGDGNYLDLLMKMSGYESSTDLAVLQTQSFKVIRFQSDELQSMNPADRQRFKTFLGNVSPATIFIADVRDNTYQSNSVPFSPGVYEQKVYDALKQFATKATSR